MEDFETIAQEVSGLGRRVSDLEQRLEHVEKVNAGLEEAALTTARALQEISAHWDKVYEAVQRNAEVTRTPRSLRSSSSRARTTTVARGASRFRQKATLRTSTQAERAAGATASLWYDP